MKRVERELYRANKFAQIEVLSLLPLIEQRVMRAKPQIYDIEILLTFKKYLTILLDIPEEISTPEEEDSLMIYTGTSQGK